LARFVRGEIVAVPFPVPDKPKPRFRPALIVAAWPAESGTDYLACVIATQPSHDPHFLEITAADLGSGSMTLPAYVRPSYLFAVDEDTIARRVGSLTPEKLDAVLSTLASLFR
jgi:mRNA-degrading endonuclease toxin of MazEF toxin-antitoxin module